MPRIYMEKPSSASLLSHPHSLSLTNPPHSLPLTNPPHSLSLTRTAARPHSLSLPASLPPYLHSLSLSLHLSSTSGADHGGAALTALGGVDPCRGRVHLWRGNADPGRAQADPRCGGPPVAASRGVARPPSHGCGRRHTPAMDPPSTSSSAADLAKEHLQRRRILPLPRARRRIYPRSTSSGGESSLSLELGGGSGQGAPPAVADPPSPLSSVADLAEEHLQRRWI